MVGRERRQASDGGPWSSKPVRTAFHHPLAHRCLAQFRHPPPVQKQNAWGKRFHLMSVIYFFYFLLNHFWCCHYTEEEIAVLNSELGWSSKIFFKSIFFYLCQMPRQSHRPDRWPKSNVRPKCFRELQPSWSLNSQVRVRIPDGKSICILQCTTYAYLYKSTLGLQINHLSYHKRRKYRVSQFPSCPFSQVVLKDRFHCIKPRDSKQKYNSKKIMCESEFYILCKKYMKI